MKNVERQLRLLGEFSVECVIVGGAAATVHGSSYPTNDLDVCYERNRDNLERIVKALKSSNAHLRGAPQDLPFILDVETLREGLNFTVATEAGNLDLLGEVQGVGRFDNAKENAQTLELFGYVFNVLALPKLIAAKRAAGRNKDLLVLPELEAIYEYRQSQGEET